MRGAALVLLVALAACSPKGPPRGPDYTPVDSPEAPTPCPDERAAAQNAREDVLERGDAASRQAAAELVFASAECERRAFEAMKIARADSDAMMDRVRAARSRYLDADRLYEEVTRSEVATLRARSMVRRGDLDARFAELLVTMPVPVDRRDPGDAQAFRDEQAELARGFLEDAAAKYGRALDAGLEGDDRAAACLGLAKLGSRHDAC